ncbi:uncharacterized protein PFL1_02126 [Pseudozyma flocculosa PF-1]|nr:uncharacterized protein PFL1_02126 [Pseudozyma flocculosa PF-1]EPQ30602.1 hypothetical protein PFL1_02126 [Pseudozyma flocculosa PF-1]
MVHLLPPSALADIPRASKGSLQRGRAYQQYEPLIAKIYKDFEEGRSISLVPEGATANGSVNGKRALAGDELVAWLIDTIERLRGGGGDAAASAERKKDKPISGDTDLFVAGVDSIQAARIRAAIHQHIELGGQLLQKNVVYDYPTPALLASHIQEVGEGRPGGAADGESAQAKRDDTQHRLMEQLVEKYSSFPALDVGPNQTGDDEQRELVVLTGVTGALGAHLFDQVRARCAQAPARIVCLVRAEDEERARTRVLTSLKARRLPSSVEHVEASGTAEVLCLAADLAASTTCGLSEDQLRQLSVGCGRVTTVHAAWAVNFVGSLQSFEAEQIAGLRNLIQLHRRLAAAAGSSDRSHFAFCSSVASILGAPPSTEFHTALSVAGDGDEAYAETLPSSPRTAAAMGYARSKWVAEHICARYGRQTGEGCSVMRFGQLCSDTAGGVWNESEGWPLLIRTADEVGCLPMLDDERLAWLPVDVAAASIVDLVRPSSPADAAGGDSGDVPIYHLVADAAKAAPWESLLVWLSREMDFERVSPRRWIERLEADEERIKARGMLELWRRNYAAAPSSGGGSSSSSSGAKPARIDASHAQAGSASLRSAPPVDEQLIRRTVTAWRQSGFLGQSN